MKKCKGMQEKDTKYRKKLVFQVTVRVTCDTDILRYFMTSGQQGAPSISTCSIAYPSNTFCRSSIFGRPGPALSAAVQSSSHQQAFKGQQRTMFSGEVAVICPVGESGLIFVGGEAHSMCYKPRADRNSNFVLRT